MTFFKNNWITFHYNFDKTHTKRTSKWDVFSYASKERSLYPKSLKEEIKKTCEEIYLECKKLNTKLGVFLSGGVDSEIIARTLKELDIPFENYFVLFHHDLNQHEREIVEKFSKQTGCIVNFIDIDFEQWLQSDNDDSYRYYATTYKTFDLSAPMQLWARNKISNGVSMTSGLNEPHLYKSINTETLELEWMHVFDESAFMARMDFATEYNFLDFPFFYLHRPELYAAYCYDPYVVSMISNPYKLSLASTKKEMLKKYFPDMEVRPKYTGFENLNREIIATASSKDNFGYMDGQIRIKHTEIYKLFNNEK